MIVAAFVSHNQFCSALSVRHAMEILTETLITSVEVGGPGCAHISDAKKSRQSYRSTSGIVVKQCSPLSFSRS